MTDPEATGRLGPWAGFLLALAFLTRIPVRLPPAAVGVPLARAVWAFPLVGMIVGAAGGAVYAGAWALGLPPALAALLAVTAQLLLTGALHEDGLADTADGFGGGTSVERKLAIMRDSRIGTYGVCAVALALAFRVGAIAALAHPLAVATLAMAAAALSRAAMAALMVRMSPARSEGLGASAGRPRAHDGWIAALVGLAIALLPVILTSYAPILVILPAIFAASMVSALAQRQIGGYTGDVLGAAQQAVEIAVLLIFVAASPNLVRIGL